MTIIFIFILLFPPFHFLSIELLLFRWTSRTDPLNFLFFIIYAFLFICSHFWDICSILSSTFQKLYSQISKIQLFFVHRCSILSTSLRIVITYKFVFWFVFVGCSSCYILLFPQVTLFLELFLKNAANLFFFPLIFTNNVLKCYSEALFIYVVGFYWFVSFNVGKYRRVQTVLSWTYNTRFFENSSTVFCLWHMNTASVLSIIWYKDVYFPVSVKCFIPNP